MILSLMAALAGIAIYGDIASVKKIKRDIEYRKHIGNCEKTEGIVTDTLSYKKMLGTKYNALVEYKVFGEKYERQIDAAKIKTRRIGDKVNIWVDKSNPEYILEDRKVPNAFFDVLLVIFSAAYTLMLIPAIIVAVKIFMEIVSDDGDYLANFLVGCIVMSVLSFLNGLVVNIMYLYKCRKNRKHALNSECVDAIVERCWTDTEYCGADNDDTITVYYADICYNIFGNTYSKEVRDRDVSWRKGDKVKVYVAKDNPLDVALDDGKVNKMIVALNFFILLLMYLVATL